jgi:DNA-binding transcriptional MerR regulator
MSEERNFETEARQQGWVGKEDFKGDPEKWTDAQSFVEKGEKIAGIANKRARELKDLLDQTRETNRQASEHFKKTLERERKEHESEIKRLTEVRKKAITDGDGDTFTRADERLNELRKDTPTEVDPEKAKYDRLATQWASDNDWYGQNGKLTGYADGIAERVANEGYSGKAYFTELTRRVKEEFPEEFKNPNRGKANGVESGGEKGSNSKAKSYENLPADAKKACDKFVRDIPNYKREDYLNTYEWE